MFILTNTDTRIWTLVNSAITAEEAVPRLERRKKGRVGCKQLDSAPIIGALKTAPLWSHRAV